MSIVHHKEIKCLIFWSKNDFLSGSTDGTWSKLFNMTISIWRLKYHEIWSALAAINHLFSSSQLWSHFSKCRLELNLFVTISPWKSFTNFYAVVFCYRNNFQTFLYFVFVLAFTIETIFFKNSGFVIASGIVIEVWHFIRKDFSLKEYGGIASWKILFICRENTDAKQNWFICYHLCRCQKWIWLFCIWFRHHAGPFCTYGCKTKWCT